MKRGAMVGPRATPFPVAPATVPNGWSLTIVVPAYNEEESIAQTARECLDAAEKVEWELGITPVEVIVVSDGSTDRTALIAQSIPGTEVVVLPTNRGYGAALKEGFRRGRGTLLGFLDADGTCDARSFVEMCRRLIAEQADLVVGSRLGPESKMPAIRKLGNHLFAWLLAALCGRRVSDTASGMRVIRREAFDSVSPLPNGMHFTPSMSARTLLSGMHVIEIPIPYAERKGTSKLRLLGDGYRFARAIMGSVLCYRPERIFLFGFTSCLFLGLALAALPIRQYVEHGDVEEWMIYRVLTSFLLGSVGFLLLCAAALANRMTTLSTERQGARTYWASAASRLFEGKTLFLFLAASASISLVLLWPGLVAYVTTGEIWPHTLHWSRMTVGIFGWLLTIQAGVTGVLQRVLAMWEWRRQQRGAATGSAAGRGAGVSQVSTAEGRDAAPAATARADP